jgi:hypothetical protein
MCYSDTLCQKIKNKIVEKLSKKLVGGQKVGGGSRAIPRETSSYIDVFKWCFMSRHLGNWFMSSHLIFFNTTFYKHFKRWFQEPLPPFCWLLKHQFHCLAVLDCFSRIRLKPTGNIDKTGGTGLNQMSS